MTAIIWKVEPLPRPAVKKEPHKHHVESEKAAGAAAWQGQKQQAGKQRHQDEVNQRHPHAAETVGDDPAERARASAPMNGPKKASLRISTAGNWVFASMAKPAEKADERAKRRQIEQA